MNLQVYIRGALTCFGTCRLNVAKGVYHKFIFNEKARVSINIF